jgi:hypothetical protein
MRYNGRPAAVLVAARRMRTFLQPGKHTIENRLVPCDDPALEQFLKLADNLGELEVTVGERARPVVAEVREGLRTAVACRQRGDLPGSLAALKTAMERLAAMGGELDPEEGALMRVVAERFSESLRTGDRSTAKAAVNLMRRKAGDPKDDDKSNW